MCSHLGSNSNLNLITVQLKVTLEPVRQAQLHANLLALAEESSAARYSEDKTSAQDTQMQLRHKEVRDHLRLNLRLPLLQRPHL